ncbi:MAG: hypothetical protein H8D78_10805 [Chloroflexi bacterium]|nr:hypothetical protein [Chloroflexota bacterium]
MTRLDTARQRFWGALDRQFETRRRIARAKVTAVQRDSSGRATSVTATIDDGATGQPIGVPYGMTVGVGSVLEVENVGLITQPAWRVADVGSGMPGHTTTIITTPGDTTIINESGLVLGNANLLRNGDFTLRHRQHLNQPVGWVSSHQTQSIGALGEK